MTTDEMLIELVKYEYECAGFPYVFMDYSMTRKTWSITWRNPMEFENKDCREAPTPNEACKRALDFIHDNPSIFKYRSETVG